MTVVTYSPEGYIYGSTWRPGRRRHYVKDEPFQRRALCGVHCDDVSCVAIDEQPDICPKCKRLAAEAKR